MSDRLQAAEDALRKVQAQAAALEGLSEELSLAVHVLEAEIGGLGEQIRAEAARAASSQPSAAQLAHGTDVEGARLRGTDVERMRLLGTDVEGARLRSTDVEGARLVALNMALEGQPREGADRYLAEHFDVPDRETLLDEIYAAAGR